MNKVNFPGSGLSFETLKPYPGRVMNRVLEVKENSKSTPGKKISLSGYHAGGFANLQIAISGNEGTIKGYQGQRETDLTIRVNGDEIQTKGYHLGREKQMVARKLQGGEIELDGYFKNLNIKITGYDSDRARLVCKKPLELPNGEIVEQNYMDIKVEKLQDGSYKASGYQISENPFESGIKQTNLSLSTNKISGYQFGIGVDLAIKPPATVEDQKMLLYYILTGAVVA